MTSRKLQLKNIFRILFLSVLFFVAQSCKISYSLSGASLSPLDKTVTVDFFINRASNVQPTLSQVFTDALKDQLISQTSLNLLNEDGDLYFEGEITNYETKPISTQADETASSNRLTITVQVRYTSKNQPKNDFSQSFSRYADYESSETLGEIEEELIEQIVEQLTEDIFNKAVVNW